MKRIVLLGSTGSIGCNVLDVVSRHAGEFEVVGIAAHRSGGALAGQCRDHPGARFAMTAESGHAEALAAEPRLAERSVGCGPTALRDLVLDCSPDLVVNAVVGFAGLEPTMAALEAGIPVAIANKETVVTGGEILQETARRSGADIIPIDSEHVAISQCIRGDRADVERVIMTASGGALRARPLGELAGVSVEDVLRHPTWDMGAKITVDSATLVNKGLEVIEAHWLFDLAYDRIDVVVHPQSIVHSFVEFVDGSVLAQLGVPDMRLPILFALSYPKRLQSELRDNVWEYPNLSFEHVDHDRYPCFDLVVEAGRSGGNAPTVLNAANEIAVSAFLAGEVPFPRIQEIIGEALAGVRRRPIACLSDIIETDRETREWIRGRYAIGAANESKG